MKKLLLILFSFLLLVSCGNVQKQTKDSTKKEIENFFKKPLLNENGEEIAVDGFKLKTTKDFKIIDNTINIYQNKILFTFIFEIQNPKMDLEYVKVQCVVPGNILTFIDETLKNKTTESNTFNGTKIITSIENRKNRRFWVGVVKNMPNTIYRHKSVDKYLFKYTIKPKNKPEVIIYQPSFLPILCYSTK